MDFSSLGRCVASLFFLKRIDVESYSFFMNTGMINKQCFLNRILSLDARKFEQQLIYHTSNNKQRTIRTEKFIRVQDFYGQITTVKESATHAVSMTG